MAKLVKVSPTKAYRIEAIQIDDNQMISIRQMYATKKDPKLKPGRQGLTIPLEQAERVAKWIKQLATDPNTEFTVLEARGGSDE
jgi:hypothetical protein